jgi:hypothetical protein
VILFRPNSNSTLPKRGLKNQLPSFVELFDRCFSPHKTATLVFQNFFDEKKYHVKGFLSFCSQFSIFFLVLALIPDSDSLIALFCDCCCL